MAVEDIVKKIVSDAQKKAETIINSYKAEADKIIKEKTAELEKRRKEEKAKIKKEVESHKLRAIQIANLEMRKKILSEKQKLIQKVFQKAEDSVKNMPEKEYKEFIKNKIISFIETGNEEIIVGNQDKNIITNAFVEDLNNELKNKLREKANLKISTDKTEIDKGFILKHGKIRVNCSLDSFMKEAREESEEKVVQILFSKDK